MDPVTEIYAAFFLSHPPPTVHCEIGKNTIKYVCVPFLLEINENMFMQILPCSKNPAES
jgi:hypothetical protein